MSLNGLDSANVAEAYQGALANGNGGGWFLLKYVSRDAVEVLARGNGGAAEARGAVAQYEEPSPLYGFLLYRRRKVLIKYVPEGTSRLLQARVAVHFTAVQDRFTPHDTAISIASADELADAALAAACSLHTAATSSCSSSGSSRRKLDEITEDAEEGQPADDRVAATSASVPRPSTAASSKPTITGPIASELSTNAQSRGGPARDPSVDPSQQPIDETQPTLSHAALDALPKDDRPEAKVSGYRESLKAYDDLFKHGPDPRLSSQTARPAMSDLYAEIYAQYKPKVKLAPRLKQSTDAKRPHTSGPGAQNASRPVSSLPAGMRVANRKAPEPKRPKSRESSVVPSIAFPPPPPVPSIPDVPLPSPGFASKSPASVRSMPLPNYSSHSQKSTGITPEKQRLMKALELRKRQIKAKQEKKESPTADDSHGTAIKADASSIHDTAPSPKPPVVEDQSRHFEKLPTNPSGVDNTSSRSNTPTLGAVEATIPTDGNAVNISDNRGETDDQHSAASASSPTSAQTQGSSCADSTKDSTRPSSISEDETDRTDLPGQLDRVRQISTFDSSESPQTSDEKESVESSPTVIAESITPVPSIEVGKEPDEQSSSDGRNSNLVGQSAQVNRTETTISPPSDQDDGSLQRRNKRESMIFIPSQESSQHQTDTSPRRNKRESMVLPAFKGQIFVETKEKRRTIVDPIHVPLSAENSEAEYFSDDSFMEELQSAKLEEAKPVQVSKSPITPFFPRKPSVSEVSLPERSASQQLQSGRLSPQSLKGRKASGPWPPQHANTDTVVVAKKINVSSGISQRIKALAEKSNRDSTASVSSLATPDASASIVAQRKSSFFSTPSPGDSPPSAKNVNRLSRASFANLLNTPTPDHQPKQSISQSSKTKESTAVYQIKQEAEKPESVQVTARIVRDARTQRPNLAMPNENTPLELHQSPIIIDHHRSTKPNSSVKSPIKASTPKFEPTSPRPPSSSHSRDQSAGLPRSSSESSWRSFGRRLSESKAGGSAARSNSTHSFESTDERKEDKKDKKDSRTTKLFKRMSSISSITRRNSGTPGLEEFDVQPTSLPSLREPPPAVQVGDLNVQFPDTLLWKRRWVEIDAAGNLVLSLSKSNEQSKGITKRYHLSEFRAPYPPDQDRQELPNSVVLDFIDGRTLQCACETYVAQVQVLQILREAHDAWIAYNQGL